MSSLNSTLLYIQFTEFLKLTKTKTIFMTTERLVYFCASIHEFSENIQIGKTELSQLLHLAIDVNSFIFGDIWINNSKRTFVHCIVCCLFSYNYMLQKALFVEVQPVFPPFFLEQNFPTL